MQDQAQQVDSPSDFGDDEQAKVSRWISELTLAEKEREPWVTRCRQIIKHYEGDKSPTNDVKARRFCLLWSNIQTLAPACYARTPTAVVSRRWKNADDAARTASEVMERALNFSLDAQDFADTMMALRDEFLLVGRGQAWVRYVPHMVTVPGKPAESPDGEVAGAETEPYEAVAWEEALADHVHWEDFGTNPARTWAEVRFVWRRAFMTRDELVDRFGEKKGKDCPLDWKANSQTGDKDKDTQFAKAAIYEIWDKITRKVFWVCKAYTATCLDERDDPLELKDFFPCPRPLLGTCGPNTIIPTPDYVFYQSQAREIDELTKRIGLLTDALKVRGFYAGTENQKLTDLLSAETNTIVPIDAMGAFVQNGGMKGVVDWFPVDMVAGVLKSCIETRQQMLEDVYQITGIADIMRGDTDPDETAAAQKIKATWGSSRVRDKQKEIGRFARDLLRIMGELIAKKFSPDTLSKMTGVDLFPDPQVKAQVQQQLAMQAQMQAAQAAQAQSPTPMAPAAPRPPAPPIDPKTERMLADPTWSEVEQLLKDNAMRTFRIEIETDSTIEPNDEQEKTARISFIEAVATYLEKTGPILQLAPEMLPVMVEGLKFLVRGFRVGREMEDVIEQALDQLQARAQAAQSQPQGHDPAAMMKAQADQTRAQADTVRAGADKQNADTAAFRAQAEARLGAQQLQVDASAGHADRQADLAQNQAEIEQRMREAMLDASMRSFTHDIRQPRLIQSEPGGPQRQ